MLPTTWVIFILSYRTASNVSGQNYQAPPKAHPHRVTSTKGHVNKTPWYSIILWKDSFYIKQLNIPMGPKRHESTSFSENCQQIIPNYQILKQHTHHLWLGGMAHLSTKERIKNNVIEASMERRGQHPPSASGNPLTCRLLPSIGKQETANTESPLLMWFSYWSYIKSRDTWKKKKYTQAQRYSVSSKQQHSRAPEK